MPTALSRPALLIALVLALHKGLAMASLPDTAATYDESVHLAAGYSYWSQGDWSLNPEHPPLAKLIAAAPLRRRSGARGLV